MGLTKKMASTTALPQPMPLVHKRHSLEYQFPETKALVDRVEAAAWALADAGESMLKELHVTAARWCKGDPYIFILDTLGNMVMHPDPVLRGFNQLGYRDLDGKLYIRQVIDVVTRVSDIPEGWVHARFSVPGVMMPRWMSTYAKRTHARGGRELIVCSSICDERIEPAFMVDLVLHAVGELERLGVQVFTSLRDPLGFWNVKDASIFVLDMDGVCLVDPAYPFLESVKLTDQKDASGKYFVRDMIEMVTANQEGWVKYFWPRPGARLQSQKSVFVHQAHVGANTYIVGCGAYLPGAPSLQVKQLPPTSDSIIKLVHDAGVLLSKEGEKAYAFFRQKDSEWFHDDSYIFIFSPDGRRLFHASEPGTEGRMDIGLMDTEGRPIVRMILDVAASPKGEGWIHYMYPEPGGVIPVWKSSYVRKIQYPDGSTRIVGTGIYRMQMDKQLIKDLVTRASALVSEKGRSAFQELRDRKGPYTFMDTYVFVQTPTGLELVNPVYPFLEGKYLLGMHDQGGQDLVQEEIRAAMKYGEAWVEGIWYRPGDHIPARKHTFVQRTECDGEVLIVGSGYYEEPGI